MYSIVRLIQGTSSRPHIHETGRGLPFRSIEEALKVTASSNEALKGKYGFKVTKLIGIRDCKTGRFVA